MAEQPKTVAEQMQTMAPEARVQYMIDNLQSLKAELDAGRDVEGNKKKLQELQEAVEANAGGVSAKKLEELKAAVSSFTKEQIDERLMQRNMESLTRLAIAARQAETRSKALGILGDKTEGGENVSEAVKLGVASFKPKFTAALGGISAFAGKSMDTLKYLWKNFVSEPLSGFFGKFDFPPIGLYAKQMIASMLPAGMGAAMKQNVEAELRFRSLLSQAENIAETQNKVRAKKSPPLPPITFSLTKDNFEEFSLLTPDEQSRLPRKVMTLIKQGGTDITFDTLYTFEEKPEEKKEEKKQDEVQSPELTPEGFPKTAISFADLQKGVEIGAFGTVTVAASPAGITVGPNTWRITGKPFTKAMLATFRINKAEWTGSKLDLAVQGKFGMTVTEEASLSSKDVQTLLKHLTTSKADYQLYDNKGAPLDAVLKLV